MIHEILFNIWNCSSNSNSEDEWFNVIELHEFLHPAERKLLQRIMHIAWDHRSIQEFIKIVQLQSQQLNQIKIGAVQEVFQGNNLQTSYEENPTGIEDTVQNTEDLRDGLYLRAFCNGLNVALEEYRNDVIDLETKILKNPQLPLLEVLSTVESYTILFDALKSMIRLVKTERLHGCLLIGRLQTFCDCGIKPVADATNKIICSINTVFYRHLCNWIIYGDLIDVHQEFFICDAKCPDQDFLWSATSSEARNDLETFNASLRGIRRPPKVRKFYVRTNLVPSHITLKLAEVILFIGRMVWIIRNDPTQTQNERLKLKFHRDIWDGKETYYYEKLQQLENQPFNLARFQRAIEECRMCLTKYLWTIMVEEAKLFEHLQLLRDYYALGRGELFQQFIVSVQENLKPTPDQYLALKLNAYFNETVKKMYSDSDKTYKRFELVFPEHLDKSSTFEPWLQIQMNFEMAWPLHIIFHPSAMALYNRLFNFSMRVKKTQVDLQNLWRLHKEHKHKLNRGVWTLRNNLMLLINNLQYYLQVDVIETEFSLLIKSVTNAQNVESIIKLHAEFLGNLMSRTFLMVMNEKKSYNEQESQLYKQPLLNYETENPVHKILIVFMQLCEQFCLEASTWDAELTTMEKNELVLLQRKFDLLVDHLLGILYSLREHTSGTHLLQLLQRIDYNRSFSKHKSDFHLPPNN